MRQGVVGVIGLVGVVASREVRLVVGYDCTNPTHYTHGNSKAYRQGGHVELFFAVAVCGSENCKYQQESYQGFNDESLQLTNSRSYRS